MKNKIILTIGVFSLIAAIFTGCASWERGVKDFTSDFSGGLDRTVEVYDYSGNLLKTYEGRIDIEYTETGNEVKFDLNGKRKIIYNAIVIVEED